MCFIQADDAGNDNGNVLFYFACDCTRLRVCHQNRPGRPPLTATHSRPQTVRSQHAENTCCFVLIILLKLFVMSCIRPTLFYCNDV